MEPKVVLVFPVDGRPYFSTVTDLESMQGIVGGPIEVIHPLEDENLDVYVNEEGKLRGLHPNKVLYNERAQPYDTIMGSFFVSRGDPFTGEQVSLRPTDVKVILDYFGEGRRA